MSNYFIQWGHTYIIHFGAWVSFMLGTQVYKNGIPELMGLSNMFKSALILAAILSAFSSHSHNHYLNHLAIRTSVLK